MQTQITANADGLASKVSNTEYQQNKADIDAELLKQSNALTAAQNNLSTLQSAQGEANQKLIKAQEDLKKAQDAVTDAELLKQSNALTAAQNNLSTLQSAQGEANQKLIKAQEDLKKAQDAVTAL